MLKIGVIIVDDEPLALDLLSGYVEKTPFLVLKGKFSNAFAVLEVLDEIQPDLILLDIQMPDLNGIELAKRIDPKTKIIITTAFEKYALEGFKINALDYLLKPFSYEEFLDGVLKAERQIRLEAKSHENFKKNKTEEFIYIKSEYKQIKLPVDDIIYIEGMKDYVKIWTQSKAKPYITILSLKKLQEELSSQQFMRVHRSYIINLKKISFVEKGGVVMTNQVFITIADKYKETFTNHINSLSIN